MAKIGTILHVRMGVYDHLVSRKAETRVFRKATFYLLKDYKALFDYERGTTYFRQHKPPVEEFEPWRAILVARFLEESQANSESVSTAIELLASVDPPLAIRLHNTLRNTAFVFRRNLGQVAEQDEKTYAELLTICPCASYSCLMRVRSSRTLLNAGTPSRRSSTVASRGTPSRISLSSDNAGALGQQFGPTLLNEATLPLGPFL